MAEQEALTQENTQVVDVSEVETGDRFPIAGGVAIVHAVNAGRKSVMLTLHPTGGGSLTKHIPHNTQVRVAKA